jgi:Tat protein secretion system quality control protein TatD with DNase activity
MFRRSGTLRHLPLDRLLTETDHPYGDHSGPEPHQPGNVLPVVGVLRPLDIHASSQQDRLSADNNGLIASAGLARAGAGEAQS